MRRIYLGGPMTGLPEYNFPAFAAEAERLRSLGFDVVNPAEINPEGGTWEECMRRDVALLVTCDHVATLPGWDKSQGAQLAHTITACQQGYCLTPITYSSALSDGVNGNPRLSEILNILVSYVSMPPNKCLLLA